VTISIAGSILAYWDVKEAIGSLGLRGTISWRAATTSGEGSPWQRRSSPHILMSRRDIFRDISSNRAVRSYPIYQLASFVNGLSLRLHRSRGSKCAFAHRYPSTTYGTSPSHSYAPSALSYRSATTTMSTLLSRAHCLCTALSHMSRGIKRVRGHFQLFVHQFHSVHNRQRRTSTLCTRTMAKHRERALGPYTCLFINTNNTQKCPRSSNMNRLKVNKNSSIHHQGTSNWSKSKQAT